MKRKDVLYVDIECYRNYFFVGLKRKSDGRRLGFEKSFRARLNDQHLRSLLRKYTLVTFNGKTYDIPMIALALSGASNDELKEASDKIIKGNLKYWEVESELGVIVNKKWDHIDLIEPNPSVMASLKTLNGRMHGKRLQDLPFEESRVLSDEEMDIVSDYCLVSDLDATEILHNELKEAIELREDLGKLYGRDFRSMSDAQVGENIVKIRFEQMTGKKPKRKDHKVESFKYKVPDFIKFKTPMLQEVLETIRNTTIHVKRDGKVEFPDEWEKFDIRFGDMKYKLGIGGLHSTESNRAVRSDNQYVLVDADVASQYPSIIMLLKLFPKAFGPEFLKIYGEAIKTRVDAKRESKQLKALESKAAEIIERLKHLGVLDKGGKIQLNGVYGKLGSIYSALYAPHMLIATTLTGQLTLLMLIEASEEKGIHIVSANTDGVVFQCPREMYEGLDGDKLNQSPLWEITTAWEEMTGFTLEFAEYKALYNRDVNAYFAIKADGKAKRKGVYANHWHPDSPDFDTRSKLMKNPQMTILGDAVLAHIKDGIEIEKYIREYDDIRGFVTVVNATGGATWRKNYLGKVVRFYWSTDGDPIIKVKPNDKGTHPKVPKTDGCKPCMMLPDELPDDIDYERYIVEAKNILTEIGYSTDPIRHVIPEQGRAATYVDVVLDLIRRQQ